MFAKLAHVVGFTVGVLVASLAVLAVLITATRIALWLAQTYPGPFLVVLLYLSVWLIWRTGEREDGRR